MTSKGPVDFFLGVFLEFGAAFCLLFFLPQVPWHWLPAKSGQAVPRASAPLGVAAADRRVLLRPVQATVPSLAGRASEGDSPSTRFTPSPSFREAPPLIPAEPEANPSPASARSPPQTSQPQTSFYRRAVPRPYHY